ncbi:MAG: hypothetical protein HFH97_07000 [Lachnospiraceae bacterium]|jgi:ABC-2 type transport system permease protein|nr:ABC-2 family transporter protein [uncultured Acetatifactor sp.]MCI9232166.1 hypothetical protein [Lachnospiraceae bacterium]MCI9572345.1 hypothetical protein [Lachnospiraceae bacterium]
MRKTLERYYALFSANLQQTMAYRFGFFTSFLGEVVKICVMLAVWMAVYRQRSTIAGFDYPMMVTYLLVSQTVNNVYGFKNDAERLISKRILDGSIVFDLLRPVGFVNARLAENAGQTVLQAVFSGLTLLCFKLFLPELSGPASLVYCLLFAVSMCAGFFIMFSVSAISGLLAFWLMNNWGLRSAKAAIVNFFSGALVPIAMMPGWMQGVMEALPFKNIVYVPTMIYMGQYDIRETFVRIGMQIFWAAVMWLLAKALCGLAIRRVSINGG